MDVLPDVPMSYSPRVSPEFAVDRVSLGDGYEQRRPSGLNSAKERWSVSFNNLSQSDYMTIYSFLKAREGVRAFLWTPPWESVARQWVCESIDSQRPSDYQVGSVQAVFVEDFTP